MKKYFLFSIILFLALGACKNDDEVSSGETNNPPIVNTSETNILLVIADDMGVEATPGYNIGSIKPNMPTLQGLAANGITYDNAWSYPVCSPTRASILTGRYGYRTGVLNPTSASTISNTEKSLHAFLDENTNSAYSHALIGKWHLSNNVNRINQLGIGYYAGILGGGVPDYYNWSLTENDQTNAYEGYSTSKITDLAIDWIQEQDKPWLCWVAYNAAHTPLHLPPADLHSQGNLPSDQASVDANPQPYFMTMIEAMDTEMGRLIDQIPADELDNTVIIFIGDNGTSRSVTQAPFGGASSKGSLLQGGVHVPLIISGKGVNRLGQRDESLVNSTDLFATISEIAGVDLSTYEDSQSFKTTFTDANAGTRAYNYSEVLDEDDASKSGYTIRDAQYKFIQYDNGSQRLYDLINDPYEATNLLNGNGPNATEEVAMERLIAEGNTIRN